MCQLHGCSLGNGFRLQQSVHLLFMHRDHQDG
uniref:Uncharacterized protein n=1 Tax=Anguilla anguilla TaxID=7936 RepID=A0A0E9TCL1_ANGAN